MMHYGPIASLTNARSMCEKLTSTTPTHHISPQTPSQTRGPAMTRARIQIPQLDQMKCNNKTFGFGFGKWFTVSSLGVSFKISACAFLLVFKRSTAHPKICDSCRRSRASSKGLCRHSVFAAALIFVTAVLILCPTCLISVSPLFSNSLEYPRGISVFQNHDVYPGLFSPSCACPPPPVSCPTPTPRGGSHFSDIHVGDGQGGHEYLEPHVRKTLCCFPAR